MTAHTLLVGSGRIATAAGEALVARGGAVSALRRDVAPLPPSFRPIAADLMRPLPRRLPRVDALVVTLTPSVGGDRDPAGYLAALDRVIQALPARPARTVFVSSTRVFGQTNAGRPLTEADRPRPDSGRGAVLLAGEELAAAALGAVTVRAAGIYGPGREWLVRRALAGEPIDAGARTNRVHADDLVATVLAALAADSPPPLVHAVDAEPAPLGDVLDLIADRLGAPRPPRDPNGPGGGKGIGGTELARLGVALRYPSYREGYGELLRGR